MKRLPLAALVVALSLCSLVGCASAPRAKAPLAETGIGTTTLTSIELPPSRMPVAQWEEDDDAPPVVQTWGVPSKSNAPASSPR